MFPSLTSLALLAPLLIAPSLAKPINAPRDPQVPDPGVVLGAGTSTSANTTATSNSSSISSSGSGSGASRGLLFNDGYDISGFANSKIKFAMNWDQNTVSPLPGAEFVPQLWGPTHESTWVNNVNEWYGKGSRYFMGPNEPDQPASSGGSAMTVEQAAQEWKAFMEPIRASHGDVKLGTPGVSAASGAGMGLDWMGGFFTACSDCHFDFLTVHWYGNQIQDLSTWLKSACDFASQKGITSVWLTEAGLNAKTLTTDQLSELTQMLDGGTMCSGSACVDHYVWNGANAVEADFLEGKGPTLTNVGKQYSS